MAAPIFHRAKCLQEQTSCIFREWRRGLLRFRNGSAHHESQTFQALKFQLRPLILASATGSPPSPAAISDRWSRRGNRDWSTGVRRDAPETFPRIERNRLSWQFNPCVNRVKAHPNSISRVGAGGGDRPPALMCQTPCEVNWISEAWVQRSPSWPQYGSRSGESVLLTSPRVLELKHRRQNR